jgi:hypothetical protein
MNMFASPFLTLFSAPKPFTDGHVSTIQRNAIRSWTELGSDVEVVLIGDETGIAENALKLGVKHLPHVEKNAQGTPLVSSIFQLARTTNESPMLAYINADIIVLPDFLASAKEVHKMMHQFLLVGQRWDLDIRDEIDFSSDWEEKTKVLLQEKGRLHPPSGSDYFIFPRHCFTHIPDFAIGRAGWDNWMIFKGRWEGWKVIDASQAITIIHQDHDYGHLPNGQPHYRLPETAENIKLAGGKRAIFELGDINSRLENGKLLPPKLGWKKFWRDVETFPLARFHSPSVANLFFAIFHPRKAYIEFRQWMSKRSVKQATGND